MKTIPTVVFRYLCLLTAVVNMGGNALLLVAYQPVFTWLGVPLPLDYRGFVLESALSFTMGAVALLVFLNADKAIPLLKVGILGKGAYAVITYTAFAVEGIHWFYLIFVIWDAAYVVIFSLYWIALESPDLPALQDQTREGLPAGPGKRALMIGLSLTGNGKKAMDALSRGLQSRGYGVDSVRVEPHEALFRFPMSLFDFIRIIVRAFLRRPAPIAPIHAPQSDYDLVVVESPTWLLGIAAPIEAVFQDPANRRLFAGRDAVALVVCRGAHRRSRAMLVRWLERLGANVVTARGFPHEGTEPRRLMSLWFYLIFRRPGVPPVLAAPRYGLSENTLQEIRGLGEQLADRPRRQPLAEGANA